MNLHPLPQENEVFESVGATFDCHQNVFSFDDLITDSAFLTTIVSATSPGNMINNRSDLIDVPDSALTHSRYAQRVPNKLQGNHGKTPISSRTDASTNLPPPLLYDRDSGHFHPLQGQTSAVTSQAHNYQPHNLAQRVLHLPVVSLPTRQVQGAVPAPPVNYSAMQRHAPCSMAVNMDQGPIFESCFGANANELTHASQVLQHNHYPSHLHLPLQDYPQATLSDTYNTVHSDASMIQHWSDDRLQSVYWEPRDSLTAGVERDSSTIDAREFRDDSNRIDGAERDVPLISSGFDTAAALIAHVGTARTSGQQPNSTAHRAHQGPRQRQRTGDALRQPDATNTELCSVCGKYYSPGGNMSKHQRYHDSQLRRNRCTHLGCSASFLHPKDLRRHSRTHEE